MDSRLKLIIKSITAREYSIAHNESHKLKGIAGSFGFSEITNIAGAMEIRIKDKKYTEVDDLLIILEKLITSAITEM